MSLPTTQTTARTPHQRARGRPLRIGLANLMPDAAFAATEAQFRGLLMAGSGNHAVQLQLFTFAGLPRSSPVRADIQARYRPINRPPARPLDGLIITGTEPKQPSLRDEPYWADLAGLIDWAGHHTGSTIFSCLAAHAAVLHLDGIERRRLPVKLTGVIACRKARPHWSTEATPDIWHTPHSRWNEVREDDLAPRGYTTLTSSPYAGPDLFVKTLGSHFIFFQGHPEYDGDSLVKEYRRDVRRFLWGESETYPSLPENVFDPAIADQLAALAAKAIATRDRRLFDTVAVLIRKAPDDAPWHAEAVQFYHNWLAFLAMQQSTQSASEPVP